MTQASSNPAGRTAASSLAYGHLTPDVVLDALDAIGLRGDGRILQLNSYENRVWRVMLEDGGAIVVKAYRPGRWSDVQIDEEHRFTQALADAEVPAMAPLRLQLEPAALASDLPGRPQPWLSGAEGTLLHWVTESDSVHAAQARPRGVHATQTPDTTKHGTKHGRTHGRTLGTTRQATPTATSIASPSAPGWAGVTPRSRRPKPSSAWAA